MQLISILGAGLLCGTALAIVIPEGMGLLEESFGGERRAQNWTSTSKLHCVSPAPSPSPSPPAFHPLSAASLSSDVPSRINASESAAPSHAGPPQRFIVGVAMTVGFVLMFVVDQIGIYLSTRGKLPELSEQLRISKCPQPLTDMLCAMSHFRANKHRQHYSHSGTYYSRRRYWSSLFQ